MGDALSAKRATKHSNFAKNLERNAVFCKEEQKTDFAKNLQQSAAQCMRFAIVFYNKQYYSDMHCATKIHIYSSVQQKYKFTVVCNRNIPSPWYATEIQLHSAWCVTKKNLFTVVCNKNKHLHTVVCNKNKHLQKHLQ